MEPIEMTASQVADVQDYYDHTDSLRAMLWRRCIDEGRVIVTPDSEPQTEAENAAL